MKLFTHNLLTSSIIKGVIKGYPLKIISRKVEISEKEFSSELIARLLSRVEWSALCEAAESVGHGADVPTSVPENAEKDEEFLRKAHHLLMEIEVIDGDLVCPETGRKFPIQNGIPNMLLNEGEV